MALARPKNPRFTRKKKKKMPDKATRLYWGKVALLGCIVPCCNDPRVELHHPTGAGMGLKASDMDVIPLCFAHHNGGIRGISLHAGQEIFEEKFGTQEYLLELTRQKFEETYGR